MNAVRQDTPADSACFTAVARFSQPNYVAAVEISAAGLDEQLIFFQ